MAKAKLTRRKIAYDLNISPYYEKITYYRAGKFKITEVDEGNTITFVFSSELYSKKFVERLHENRIKINESLSNRFGLDFKCDLLADLRLYSSIEKRGFLILLNGVKVDCLENIILDGNNLIAKI